MSARKKALRLFEHEERLLVEIYLRMLIPIDQYEQRPKELQALTAEWNARSGRDDVSGDLIHFMKNRRKAKRWVRFDGKHLQTPAATDELSAAHIEILVAIYQDHVTAFQHGSDVLSCEPQLAELIAREFAERAGVSIPTHSLVPKLTALRKRGLLPKVSDNVASDLGFKDIDEVSIQVKPTLPI